MNISKTVTVQSNALIIFRSVNTYTSNWCAIGCMRWTDISITIKLKMLRFWNILMDIDNESISQYFFITARKTGAMQLNLYLRKLIKMVQFTQLHQFDLIKAESRLNIHFIAQWKLNITLNNIKVSLKIDFYTELYMSNKKNNNKRNRSLTESWMSRPRN